MVKSSYRLIGRLIVNMDSHSKFYDKIAQISTLCNRLVQYTYIMNRPVSPLPLQNTSISHGTVTICTLVKTF